MSPFTGADGCSMKRLHLSLPGESRAGPMHRPPTPERGLTCGFGPNDDARFLARRTVANQQGVAKLLQSLSDDIAAMFSIRKRAGRSVENSQ